MVQRKFAQWIAVAVFVIRIICLARPGRNDLPHKYAQNRTYKKSRSEVYGGIVQEESCELSHFRGRVSKKRRTRKFGFGRKAYITLSLIPNNVGLAAICKKQGGALKKRLLKYGMVRRASKRLRVLRVPLHNARAYGTEYISRLKSGPWYGAWEHMGKPDLTVPSWLPGLARSIAGRIRSSRLATPILPPVGSKSEFAEMLVLQAPDQAEPRPPSDTIIYASLLVAVGCMSAICIHFFLSSQG